MKYGSGKQYIRKNPEYLTIPVGKDGVGEEAHPDFSAKYEDADVDLVEQKILNIVKGIPKVPIINEEKTSRLKLYLNTLINLLYNKKTKITKESSYIKLKKRFVNWWRKDTTNDSKDLIAFVIIHGLLGASALIAALAIFNIDMAIIQIIRKTVWLSIILCIVGAGSFYYLFLDLNKVLEETWRKKTK